MTTRVKTLTEYITGETVEELCHNTIDVIGVDHVEIIIQPDSKRVWVNVNGRCRFRAYSIGTLELRDERIPKPDKIEPGRWVPPKPKKEA